MTVTWCGVAKATGRLQMWKGKIVIRLQLKRLEFHMSATCNDKKFSYVKYVYQVWAKESIMNSYQVNRSPQAYGFDELFLTICCMSTRAFSLQFWSACKVPVLSAGRVWKNVCTLKLARRLGRKRRRCINDTKTIWRCNTSGPLERWSVLDVLHPVLALLHLKCYHTGLTVSEMARGMGISYDRRLGMRRVSVSISPRLVTQEQEWNQFSCFNMQ
jgi:hypothetical protein